MPFKSNYKNEVSFLRYKISVIIVKLNNKKVSRVRYTLNPPLIQNLMEPL